MFTKTAVVAALAGLAAAAPAPISKRASAINDGVILNYALTLEHLESFFYRQALSNYTQEMFVAAGFPDPFYANLKAISADEDTHVSFLTSALQAAGVTPVAQCTYSFPATDPKSFAALSAVLEGVGISAYIGAAHDIANPNYLTAAGSILTVESRHSAYIRASQAQYPYPQAFDTPLDFDEVYTLAAQFITACPASNPPLPVKAFPSLAVASTGPIQQNSTVTIATPGYTLVPPPGGKLYAAWISVTGPTFVDATPTQGGFSVPVPPGYAGQSYVVLTSCNDQVSDDTVAAGPAIVEIEGAIGV